MADDANASAGEKPEAVEAELRVVLIKAEKLGNEVDRRRAERTKRPL